MKKLMLALCFIMLMTACVSKQISLKTKSVGINPGQSKEDIMAILGPPQNRQFHKHQEAWQYCNTGFASDYYLVIWLNNGIVTGMNSYTNSEDGLCSSFFREVNWVTPSGTGNRIQE